MQTGGLPNRRGLTYCWTSPNTSAKVSPQLQERREAPKDSIQTSQTDQTQTWTETETFLATATHQEEPSLSGKIPTPDDMLDVKIRL